MRVIPKSRNILELAAIGGRRDVIEPLMNTDHHLTTRLPSSSFSSVVSFIPNRIQGVFLIRAAIDHGNISDEGSPARWY